MLNQFLPSAVADDPDHRTRQRPAVEVNDDSPLAGIEPDDCPDRVGGHTPAKRLDQVVIELHSSAAHHILDGSAGRQRWSVRPVGHQRGINVADSDQLGKRVDVFVDAPARITAPVASLMVLKHDYLSKCTGHRVSVEHLEADLRMSLDDGSLIFRQFRRLGANVLRHSAHPDVMNQCANPDVELLDTETAVAGHRHGQ
jgi:hypothetical protein